MAINKENMEEAILNAARKLFLEKGFKGTSTTEIAREVGCNQALVHYYFRTKDRLFEAIFKNKIKFFLAALLKVDNDELPYEEKLARKIESHFEAIRENPKLPLFFFNELSANPKRMKEMRESLGELPQMALRQMETELNEEIKKGNVRKMTIYDLLMTIVSLNIIGFLGEPIFKTITGLNDEQYQQLLERRKKENVHIILSSIKPAKDGP